MMPRAIVAGAFAIALAIVSFAAGGARMKITSSAFQEGGNIPSKFTCDGSDTSPPLQITGVPSEAKSLVLIADDPDAPGGLFTHWLVWNVPPQGVHRYVFKIFALDRELDLRSGAKRSQLDAAMKGHVVAQGELMGRYSRKK